MRAQGRRRPCEGAPLLPGKARLPAVCGRRAEGFRLMRKGRGMRCVCAPHCDPPQLTSPRHYPGERERAAVNLRRNRTRLRGRPKARSPLLRGGARNRRRNAQLPAEAQGAGRQPGTFSRRLSKNPGDFERAAVLSSFNRIRRRVRRIRGNFFVGELAPGKEIASLQFPRPEMRSISAETGRGGSLPGELAPPSTSLFDKQREGRPSGLPSRLSMYASCGCAARRAGCQRLLCGVKPSPSASRTSVAITKACSSHSDMMRLSCSTSVR